MTVSQRLYLAIVPAVLGVFAVAGLAYWGQYGRQAPAILILVGVVASVASLIVAWRNTRYVAMRLTRLAPASATAPSDELEAIEGEVAQLRQAVVTAQAEEATVAAQALASVHAYADLLADAAAGAARQVDELRMPLHILLENRFGDLNENQEEMLAAAREAADDIQAHLERLGQIADVDRGTVRLRSERLRADDLLSALLPGLTAEAEQIKVGLSADIGPLLPPIQGDRAILGRALSLLISDAVHRTSAGGAVQIVVRERPPTSRSESNAQPRAVPAPPSLEIAVSHGGGVERHVDAALAERLVRLLGGTITRQAGQVIISLPATTDSGVRSARGSR